MGRGGEGKRRPYPPPIYLLCSRPPSWTRSQIWWDGVRRRRVACSRGCVCPRTHTWRQCPDGRGGEGPATATPSRQSRRREAYTRCHCSRSSIMLGMIIKWISLSLRKCANGYLSYVVRLGANPFLAEARAAGGRPPSQQVSKLAGGRNTQNNHNRVLAVGGGTRYCHRHCTYVSYSVIHNKIYCYV